MKRIDKVRRLVAGPAAAAAMVAALVGILAATAGSLPGGSAISVQITAPPDGAVVPEGPVALAGSASVGEGLPVANTLLVYVLDLSGSTSGSVSGTVCGSQNSDGISNQIIDCEIAAAKALNAAAVNAGTVLEIAAVGFGGHTIGTGSLNDAYVLDLSPVGGIQNRIAPDADAIPNGQRDLDEALFRVDSVGVIDLFTAADVGGYTNYWAAVHRAVQVANASSATNKIVVFLSDGVSNTGGPAGESVLDALDGVTGITFHTFAISNLVACSPSGTNKGTLKQIATATGGTCTELDDPQDAVEVLPQVIGSSLTGVTVSVDGGAASPAGTAAALPLTGPANTDWGFITGPLAAGTHQLCATATGSDGGGNGTVSECVTVQVDGAPTVTVTGGSGVEGSPTGVSATVTDNGSPSIVWTYAPGAGVDPGASCTFANPNAAATTIQCTDDGSFTVTATVNDGINPAVSASAPVIVANASPTIAIASPAAGATFAVGAPVGLVTTTGDPGTNDVVGCSINWGDGNTTAACGAAHAYASGGAFTITVTATDDDGGTATASVTIQVNHAPSCGGVTASPGALWPANNKLVRVTLSGGSDPDGDAISIAVTGVTQDEPASAGGDAVLAGGNLVDLRASRLGSGNGRVYEVAYTITDAHGATCSASTIVGVPHDSSGAPAVDSVVRFPSIP